MSGVLTLRDHGGTLLLPHFESEGAGMSIAASTDVLNSIGNTPLVQLRRVVPKGAARVLVKIEGANPTGSMKDRMAKAAVEGAERAGRLQSGGTVVEYTGGSTGTSLALVCAAKGYRLRIVTSDAFSQDKRDHMASLGAELTVIRSDRGQITEKLIKDMIRTAGEYADEPGCWWVDQLNNTDAASGYHPMGDEIWAQTAGIVDSFVHAVGTAHSLHGVAGVLRRRNQAIEITCVEPAESPIISEGTTAGHRIEGIGIGFVPPMWDPADADRFETVSSSDAHDMARTLAQQEAIFAGASTGANVVAALRVAERLDPQATVVTLAVDSGLKYLATEVFAGASDGAPVFERDDS